MTGRRPRGGPRIVAGRRPALEAIRAGKALEVLVARSAQPTSGLRELLAAAEGSGVPVRRVDPRRIGEVAGGSAHQGVAVSLRSSPELTEADLDVRAWDPDALVVVLDGVTDPHNVGAVARTAEAAGAAALVVRRRRGGAGGATAVKASAGALAHLPLVTVPNLVRALERLKKAGFWIVGMDGSAPATIWDGDPPEGRLAVVLGSEGSGLTRLVRESCDELVAIPLRGRVGSLNVSVAAGVAFLAYAVRPKGATGRPTTRAKKKD